MSDIIVISGLPRSGTSLMMQLLERSGVEIFTDENREADKSNPKGYYEHDGVKAMAKDNAFLKDAQGKGVKIISQLIPHLDLSLSYKVIVINRSLDEIVRSQQVMLGKDPNEDLTAIKSVFRKQREDSKVFLTKNKIPFIEINHKDLFHDPIKALQEFAKFIGFKGDIEELVSVVDAKLYRQKINSTEEEQENEGLRIKLDDILVGEEEILPEFSKSQSEKTGDVDYRPGDAYEIPVNGSLALLAYGDIGLKLWRNKREALGAKKKNRNIESK